MFLWAWRCVHCELSPLYAVHRGDLCIYCSLTAGDVKHKPEILSSANPLDICVKNDVQDKHKSLEEKMNVVKPFFQSLKLFKTLETNPTLAYGCQPFWKFAINLTAGFIVIVCNGELSIETPAAFV